MKDFVQNLWEKNLQVKTILPFTFFFLYDVQNVFCCSVHLILHVMTDFKNLKKFFHLFYLFNQFLGHSMVSESET